MRGPDAQHPRHRAGGAHNTTTRETPETIARGSLNPCTHVIVGPGGPNDRAVIPSPKPTRHVTYVLLDGAEMLDVDCGARAAVEVRRWGATTTWTMPDRSRVVRTRWGWGGSPGSAAEAADAVRQLLAVADAARPSGRAWPAAVWSSAPGTFAGWLWLRTMSDAATIPAPVTGELVDVWSGGQGRVEWFPGVDPAGPVPMQVWDARAQYPSLLGEIPLVSEWQTRSGDAPARAAKRRPPGRYWVRWTGCDRLGVIPVPGRNGRWTWPAAGEAWADPWEIHLIEAGIVQGRIEDISRCVIPSRIAHPDCLRAVRSILDPTRPGLLGRMGRTALVHLVGKLGTLRPGSSEERIPAGATPPAGWEPNETTRLEGDEIVTIRPRPTSTVQRALQQLPVASTVWGRARARLVDSPGADGTRTGAAHLPPGVLAAMRTDALWIVGHEPGWMDDGRPGRLRLLDTVTVTSWPRSIADRRGHVHG